MPKSQKLEELLAQLKEARHDPTAAESIAQIQQVLKSKQSMAIAQAAKLVREAGLSEYLPDLAAAFARMMVKPVDSDPGCLAKKEIAEALYHLEYSEESLFLQGVRHVQMEPVWGGKVDRAPTLRGVCALGLVRMNYPKVMTELADLLADPELEARIAAVRAIAYTNNPDAAPLLRLRIKVGDEPAVLTECLSALLQLDPQPALPLVKVLLYARDALGLSERVEQAEAAALALGESRLPAAWEMLHAWWQQVRDRELRRIGLLAIALLRLDAARQFLLSLLAEGELQDAADAIKALNIYRQDDDLWQQVKQIVEQRGDATLTAVIHSL